MRQGRIAAFILTRNEEVQTGNPFDLQVVWRQVVSDVLWVVSTFSRFAYKLR